MRVHLRPSGADRAAYARRSRRPGVSLGALPARRVVGVSRGEDQGWLGSAERRGGQRIVGGARHLDSRGPSHTLVTRPSCAEGTHGQDVDTGGWWGVGGGFFAVSSNEWMVVLAVT
jgi:hypothetical protein